MGGAPVAWLGGPVGLRELLRAGMDGRRFRHAGIRRGAMITAGLLAPARTACLPYAAPGATQVPLVGAPGVAAC